MPLQKVMAIIIAISVSGSVVTLTIEYPSQLVEKLPASQSHP